MATVLAGMVAFFVLEKLVIWRHCHNADCYVHDRAAPLILIGDAFHNPKKISCGVWEPFVVSLSNHERFPYTNPFGEHIKTPPTLRLAQGERGFDMLDCVFRIILSMTW